MGSSGKTSGPTNAGRAWISHGNNVITFAAAHSDTSYRWVATLSTQPMGGITPRNVPHTAPMSVAVSNDTASRGLVRLDGGYGFSTCGHDGAAVSAVTERFDDVANTHTGRTAATTARQGSAGYSLNGYGFSSCGNTGANTGATERFDDVANTHTGRTAATTARQELAGYSLGGYGFSSCGNTGAVSAVTERFDDVANTHTARTAATTARYYLAGYGTCEYFVDYLTFNA